MSVEGAAARTTQTVPTPVGTCRHADTCQQFSSAPRGAALPHASVPATHHPLTPPVCPTSDRCSGAGHRVASNVLSFGHAFAHHATAAQLALANAVQRPIALTCIQEPAPNPAWRSTPAWFLMAAEDRMINPTTQHGMAERMGAATHALAVDHTPLLTAPEQVVEIILEAAQATRSSGGSSAAPVAERQRTTPMRFWSARLVAARASALPT
jgi:pimeloyl-ACP methyl ester carboxylesterase